MVIRASEIDLGVLAYEQRNTGSRFDGLPATFQRHGIITLRQRTDLITACLIHGFVPM
jgi:hypothetical protein